MSALARFLRRLLALAILTAVVLSAALFGAAPVLERMRETEDTLAFNRDMITRLARGLADRGAQEARIAELSERLETSGLYLRAETEALAAAQLQELVKQAVAMHGGELRSLQPLPAETEEALTRIRLRVVMTCEHDTLIALLHALETGVPYLFVERLEIGSTATRRRALRDDREGMLALGLDLYGYLSPEMAE